VVLVHGIAGNDKENSETEYLGILNYWGRIPAILQQAGIQVFFGNTGGWSTCETNAAMLKETIDTVLAETNSEKVNIIAHSKGGIDARYLIGKYNYGDKIASLITMATPHHGSEIADAIYNRGLIRTKLAQSFIKSYEKSNEDKSPDMYGVLYELTTEAMSHFNETVPMDERVYHLSFYVAMAESSTDRLMSATYRHIKKDGGGDNDGLVSTASAIWGESHRIAGNLSHRDIVDMKRKPIDGVDVPLVYLEIMRELEKKGF
jgi:triacylglycerol lipase